MTTEAITPLRQRMIEDMNARKLCAGTQRGHIRSCKRFAAFLKRPPDTATLEDIRRFQLHLADTGVSICTRNCTMTGLRFLFRVTLRRLDLAAEIYHLREPQKIPQVLSPDETRRLLAVAGSFKARVMLSLSYGCGLRVSEVVRLKVKHIDSGGVTFRYKDYRADGRARYKVMTLATSEFIRRFLIHVLPDGFHRIRHYGLFASASRAENIARARQWLNAPAPQPKSHDAEAAKPDEPAALAHPCPCCGGRMIIIETFERGSTPRHRPTGSTIAFRIDTS